MSAFVVNDAHISAMVTSVSPRYPGDGASYYFNGEVHYFGGHAQAIGQKLLDENYRSVNYRYGEQDQPHQFRIAPPHQQMTPVEIIKLCNCYSYQACETPDWKDSEAYAINQAIRERAINNLPGYDDAPWGL